MKRSRIVGIYLAAGKSKRFGRNKLEATVCNDPLGSLALRTALHSQLDKIVVVTSCSDQLHWVSPELFHSYRRNWFQVPCKESMNGQSYSLQCGLRFAEKLRAEAVIILLADQPLISTEMIDKLIRQYRQNKVGGKSFSFLAAKRSNVYCPPVLFHQRMFKDLYTLQGDKGARHLIQDRWREGSSIEFMNSLLFFDVDTEEDYQKLIQKKEALMD